VSAVLHEMRPGGRVVTGSLEAVLEAWWRYAELRAAEAPLGERLAAWGALQDERRRHRAGR
jgi:hypothetical protein